MVMRRRPRRTAVDIVQRSIRSHLPQPSLTLNSPQSGIVEEASDAAQSNRRKHPHLASVNHAYHCEVYLDYTGALQMRSTATTGPPHKRSLIVAILPAVLPGCRTSLTFIAAQMVTRAPLL
jgi:hypothetical protein